MPIMLKGKARRLSKLCVSALFLFSSLQVNVVHAFWSVSITVDWQINSLSVLRFLSLTSNRFEATGE